MKKIFAFILSLIVLLTSLPAFALADGNTVEIGSAKKWNEIAGNSSSDKYLEGKTLLITKDIDFSKTDFQPIVILSGELDGQGHTLSGINITSDKSEFGAVRTVLESGYLHDITIEADIIPENGEYIGGIAGINQGRIKNCTFRGNINADSYGGGITSCNSDSGYIENCKVYGRVQCKHFGGGIAGKNDGSIDSSENRALINTEYIPIENGKRISLSITTKEIFDITDIGGIAGISKGIISNCENLADVGYPHTGYNIGGIVGILSGTVINCKNTANITGKKDIGGIVGQITPEYTVEGGGDSLKTLKNDLDKIDGRLTTLLDGLDSTEKALANSIKTLLTNIEDTEDTLSTIITKGENWAEENIDSINSLTDRVSEFTKDISPALDTVKEGIDALGDGFDALDKVSEDLNKYIDKTDTVPTDLKKSARELSDGIACVSSATDELSEAYKAFEKGFGDSKNINENLKNIASASKEFAKALSSISYTLSKIEINIPQKNESSDIIGEITEIIDSLNTLTESLSSDFYTLSASLSEISSSIIGIASGFDYTYFLSSFTKIKSAVSDINNSINDFYASADYIKDALSTIDKEKYYASVIIDDTGKTVNCFENAMDEFSSAFKTVSDATDKFNSHDKLTFSKPEGLHENTEKLHVSVSDIISSLENIQEEIDKSNVTDNTKALSKEINSALENILDDITDANEISPKDITDKEVDVSGTTTKNTASVISSENISDVSGDTNIGGIVGKIGFESDFDLDEENSISDILSGTSKYLVYSSLRNCSCNGEIQSSKDCAGGIVGSADYGDIYKCIFVGKIQAKNYAGGIAGKSLSSVSHSLAEGEIHSEKYTGGIAGLGHDIKNSISNVNITNNGEYSGSIAGNADGTVIGNKFMTKGKDGINGFAYSGKCDFTDDLNALFDIGYISPITVTLVCEGETVKTLKCDFGEIITDIPEISDGEKTFIWDGEINEPVYYSKTISGEYHDKTFTVSTDEKIPKFLASGDFSENQELTFTKYEKGYTDFADKTVLASYTVSISNYNGIFTCRMKAESDGRLYRLLSDGTYEKINYVRDGSYIVFDIESGASVVLVKNEHTVPLPIIVTVCALIAAGAVILTVIKKKAKK